jgi:hypothetical protein
MGLSEIRIEFTIEILQNTGSSAVFSGKAAWRVSS